MTKSAIVFLPAAAATPADVRVELSCKREG